MTLRTRRVAVAVVCLVVVGLSAYRAPPSFADPLGGTKDCSSTTPDTTPAGGGQPGATTTTTIAGEDGEGGVCSSLLDSIAPGDDPGPVPTSNYDIGYDQGGTCICASRRITGWTTQMLFGAATWVVRIGLGIVNWALQFHFAHLLMAPAQRISNAYQAQVVGRMGLGPFFLFLCALWAGFLAMTGKLGRGIGELGVSLVIASLAATVVTNPGAQLQRGLDFTAGVAGDVAAVSTGADPSTSTSEGELAKPMLRAIHKAFIETPHQIINWGRVIPEGDRCSEAYDTLVQNGPWGTSTKPRHVMDAAGCKVESKFNHDPSVDRLAAALLVLLASLLVVVLLVMVAATLISAQLGVLIALVLWPFAAVFGTLPGRGRSLFWRWVGQTGMELAKVLVMMMMLSLTLVGVAAVLAATQTEKLVPQFGLVCLVIVVALLKRKHFVEGTRRAVSQWTARMSGGSAGGHGGGWLQPGLAGLGAGAAFSRGQHAWRAHQTADRERAMVALSRERNDQARTFHDESLTLVDQRTDAYYQNLVMVFTHGGEGRGNGTPATRPRHHGQQPRGLDGHGPELGRGSRGELVSAGTGAGGRPDQTERRSAGWTWTGAEGD